MSAQVIRPRVRRWVELPSNSFQSFLDQHRCGVLSTTAPEFVRTEYEFDPPELLKAITRYFGERKAFFGYQVERHAKLEDENGPLRSALRGKNPTAKRLGGIFSEIQGQDFGGLSINRFDDRRDREAGFAWWVLPSR